jgi:hypothetical protein
MEGYFFSRSPAPAVRISSPIPRGSTQYFCSGWPGARRRLMSLAPTTLMPPRLGGYWVIALSMAAQTWSPSNEAPRPLTRHPGTEERISRPFDGASVAVA